MIQNSMYYVAASHFKMRYTDNLASVAFWMASSSQFVLSVWPPAGNEVTKQSLFFYQIFHSFLTFTYWEFIYVLICFCLTFKKSKGIQSQVLGKLMLDIEWNHMSWAFSIKETFCCFAIVLTVTSTSIERNRREILASILQLL